MGVLQAENCDGPVSDSELGEVISNSISSLGTVKKVLVIHPDYSRHDFSNKAVPMLYGALLEKGLESFDTLNAGGTHRPMEPQELVEKLALSPETHDKLGTMFNHEFDNPAQLVHAADLSAEFVSEKTLGNLNCSMAVDVNRLVLEDYDLIVAVSGTVPHEALGYSGGTKIFFPGISGPTVIATLHWAAVLMGIPKLIGTRDNPAREVVDAGTKAIFDKIGDTPILSLNMVYTEDENHNVVPRGLFTGYGFDGFSDAHRAATELSSKLHIVYLDEPKNIVVQRLPQMYDEVWTAGKGSYKLQREGVMAEDGEIILFAPHISCFHSNSVMDSAIREIGYHGLEYVLDFCKKNPDFDKNVASHVINVRGFGKMREGKEEFPFRVTLATQIPKEECEAVGLGYRNPEEIKKENFNDSDQLWIEDGGQWLYSRAEK